MVLGINRERKILQNSSCTESHKPFKKDEHCWIGRGELIKHFLLRIPKHGPHLSWSTSKNIHLFSADTECRLEELPRVMPERIKGFSARLEDDEDDDDDINSINNTRFENELNYDRISPLLDLGNNILENSALV